MSNEKMREEFNAWYSKRFVFQGDDKHRLVCWTSWQAASDCPAAHSAARIAELGGQVEMLVDRLSAIHNIIWHREGTDLSHSGCMEVLRKCIAPSISIQTAEEYRKRVQAEALEEFANKWLPNMRIGEYESSVTKATHNFAVGECVKHALSMASELRNPAAQAESGSATFTASTAWSGTEERKEGK